MGLHSSYMRKARISTCPCFRQGASDCIILVCNAFYMFQIFSVNIVAQPSIITVVFCAMFSIIDASPIVFSIANWRGAGIPVTIAAWLGVSLPDAPWHTHHHSLHHTEAHSFGCISLRHARSFPGVPRIWKPRAQWGTSLWTSRCHGCYTTKLPPKINAFVYFIMHAQTRGPGISKFTETLRKERRY